VSFLRYSMSKMSWPWNRGHITQGHRKCYHSIDRVFLSNFVSKTHRFWDIRLVSIQWPWNPGYGSVKVIENYTTRSGIYDFVLTFHTSNHRPISYRFRDKRQYPSKIANFPTPCIKRPDEGVPFGIWYRRKGCRMLLWWGYQMVEQVLR